MKQVSNAMISYSSFGGFCFRLVYIFYRDVFLTLFWCLMCRRMFKYSGTLLPPFLDRPLAIYTNRSDKAAVALGDLIIYAKSKYIWCIPLPNYIRTHDKNYTQRINNATSSPPFYGAVHNYNERKFKRSGLCADIQRDVAPHNAWITWENSGGILERLKLLHMYQKQQRKSAPDGSTEGRLKSFFIYLLGSLYFKQFKL